MPDQHVQTPPRLDSDREVDAARRDLIDQAAARVIARAHPQAWWLA